MSTISAHRSAAAAVNASLTTFEPSIKPTVVCVLVVPMVDTAEQARRIALHQPARDRGGNADCKRPGRDQKAHLHR